MARRIALHYVPRDSPLHRWDGRCKFLGLLLVMISLVQGNALSLTLNTILLATAFALSRLPFGRIFRDVWFWVIFLLVIFLFQMFLTPGPNLFPFLPLPASQNRLRVAAFTCWRLAVMFGFGILFTAVTRPREVQETVLWLLRPLPFLPGRRISLMVSLTLRFFSSLLDQLDEIVLANRARLANRRKNPLRRAKFLALPLLRGSLIRAEDVTLALFSRGFREDVPYRLSPVPLSHWVPLLGLLGLSIVPYYVVFIVQ